jgi:hypothetical protein
MDTKQLGLTYLSLLCVLLSKLKLFVDIAHLWNDKSQIKDLNMQGINYNAPLENKHRLDDK